MGSYSKYQTSPGDPIPTTPSIKKIESLVPAATGTLTLVVALCSFVLSFESLRSSAVEAGFDPLIAWCWPICIDALLISGSLMVLRSNVQGVSSIFRYSHFKQQTSPPKISKK
ncbi:MAG: DUF2637 domain-containing protein [Methanomicrobiales archaeon]|nr:DUF2637 domain-containing protein [Methanomicrobiales archaeon]